MADADASPCRACGACCATYRVSFYWAEAAARGLPPDRVEKAAPLIACMAGTNTAQPRCAALDGTIGRVVRCTLYAHRPTPCREVQPGDDKCAQARARHGLPVPVVRA
ncbi:MAG: YkgJ family cysteine cluster protein [Burkholderiales bacterium]|nr:YkgJ family cysteine cluster protein [Burkholderiales bacterium]